MSLTFKKLNKKWTQWTKKRRNYCKAFKIE